ncbi:hypothetical protein D3C72_1019380 [compost metagenome]
MPSTPDAIIPLISDVSSVDMDAPAAMLTRMLGKRCLSSRTSAWKLPASSGPCGLPAPALPGYSQSRSISVNIGKRWTMNARLSISVLRWVGFAATA